MLNTVQVQGLGGFSDTKTSIWQKYYNLLLPYKGSIMQ